MGRVARKYTDEFKDEAIKLAVNTGLVGQTAKDLGIPVSALHSWIHASAYIAVSHKYDSLLYAQVKRQACRMLPWEFIQQERFAACLYFVPDRTTSEAS